MKNDDDADIVWTGPFAGVVRPISAETLRTACWSSAVMFAVGVAAASPICFGWADVPGANRAGLGVVGVLGLSAALGMAIFTRLPERLYPSVGPYLFLMGTAAATVVITGAVVFAGPNFGVIAVNFVQVPVLGFVMVRVRWAIGLTGLMMAGYAVALALVDGVAVPVAHWMQVLASAMAAAILVGRIATRFDAARRAEKQAKTELADLNHHLEERVAEQVDELERTGRLRRFLSPQVADVVMSTGTEELLAPHRCEVAVLFVDLRGFTSYTNAVEADQVMGVLGEYYRAVGSILDRHGATIGGFDGDGVMAYIGDPVAVDKPAFEALVTAREIAHALDELLDGWSINEARLGYGIGIAFGVATLGVVGYESRSDYTPVGAVVNLAARLCSDATSGEIVIDDAVRVTAGVDGAVRRADVDLKGFGVVPTYAASNSTRHTAL